MIRINPNPMPVRDGLIKAVESQILKRYEVYDSQSVDEATLLLGNYHFQAILITTLDNEYRSRLLTPLVEFLKAGGTIIRISTDLSGFLPARRAPILNTEFLLEGYHIGRDDKSFGSYYVLNPNFENVFGPSVLASLDKTIRPNNRFVCLVRDSASIYKSSREYDYCAAAFTKRGGGFVGFLGDTVEVLAVQNLRTLLLAMLGRSDH